MLAMPLTPQMLLLSFDLAIYRLDNRQGEVGIIDRAKDVVAFNDLQAVRSHANLYFKDWDDRELVAKVYQEGKPRRREAWFEVQTLQETAPGSDTYVAVTKGWVHDRNRRELLHTARNVPEPAAWPLLLSYTERARRAKRGVDQSSLWKK